MRIKKSYRFTGDVKIEATIEILSVGRHLPWAELLAYGPEKVRGEFFATAGCLGSRYVSRVFDTLSEAENWMDNTVWFLHNYNSEMLQRFNTRPVLPETVEMDV